MTVILVCGPASIAQADDFTWSKVDVEPANWANSGNWSGPSGRYPDDPDERAIFNNPTNMAMPIQNATMTNGLGQLTFNYMGWTVYVEDTLKLTSQTNYGYNAINCYANGGAGTVTFYPAIEMLGASQNIHTAAGATFIVANGGFIGSYAPVISSFSPTSADTGAVRIDAASSVSSAFYLRQGTLLLRHSGALGASGSTVNIGGDSYVTNGAYARLLIDASGVSVSKNLRVRSLADHNVVATLGGNHASGSSSFTGAITLDLTTRLTAAGSSTVSFTNQLSGAGGIIKEGAGTVQLSHANSFSGDTTVSAGTLQLAAAGALPSSTNVTLQNAAGAMLDLNGYSQQVASLGGGGGAGGNVRLGNGTLTVGSGNFAGVIQGGGGGGGLIKTGSGTLTLSGANTFTGGTTISQGYLLVNNVTGLGLGSGGVTIDGGGLGGYGILGSATDDCDVAFGGSGGRLAPGASAGRLTVYGDVTLSSLAVFDVQLDGTTPGLLYDQLAVHDSSDLSTIALNDALLRVAVGYAPTLGDSFTIIDNLGSGKIGGTFLNLPDEAVLQVGVNYFRIDYQGGTGNDVVLTAVPEPATLSLLTVGLLAVASRRRRRG